MRRNAMLVVLALAACAEGSQPVAVPDAQGWRLSSGKRPSRAEYIALVAACQHGAVAATRGKTLDTCLADLGLRRAP